MTPNGPSSPSSVRSDDAVRGMTALGAMGWTFVIFFVQLLIAVLAVSLRHDQKLEFVPGAIGQVIAFSLGLFAILRVHAPNADIRKFLAVRATAWQSYPLALLLGATMWVPLAWLLGVIASRWPPPESGLQETLTGPIALRVFAMVFVNLIGPVIEEAIFRGALVRPLLGRALTLSPFTVSASSPDEKPEAPASARPIRSTAFAEVTLITAAVFVWIHAQWQMFPALFVMGLILGAVRLRSGSLFPSILVHVGFNSTALLAATLFGDLEEIPLSWAGIGLAASLPLGALLVLSFRSDAAARARAQELAA